MTKKPDRKLLSLEERDVVYRRWKHQIAQRRKEKQELANAQTVTPSADLLAADAHLVEDWAIFVAPFASNTVGPTRRFSSLCQKLFKSGGDDAMVRPRNREYLSWR